MYSAPYVALPSHFSCELLSKFPSRSFSLTLYMEIFEIAVIAHPKPTTAQYYIQGPRQKCRQVNRLRTCLCECAGGPSGANSLCRPSCSPERSSGESFSCFRPTDCRESRWPPTTTSPSWRIDSAEGNSTVTYYTRHFPP